MKKIIFILSVFLSGCNETVIEKTEIYALAKGNYGRVFMLSKGYSSEADKVIFSLGKKGGDYPYVQTSLNGRRYLTIDAVQNVSELEKTLIYYENVSLYMSVIPVAEGQTLSCKALNKLKSVYLVPEGTSIFVYPLSVIENIISFKEKAKRCGDAQIKLILWDSINNESLVNADYSISKLPEKGVNFEFVNFEKMSRSIKKEENASAFISTAFYASMITEYHLKHPLFVKDKTFDETKENILFLGSYSNHAKMSFKNQTSLLTKLEKEIDPKKYNIIYKSHPRDLSVNYWIEDKNKPISYFNIVPYEIWQMFGGASYRFIYKGDEYTMDLPRQPKEIYGIFSTSFYGEEAKKLKYVFSFNELNADGNLISETSESAIEDKAEFDRWEKITNKNKTLFSTTFDWVK